MEKRSLKRFLKVFFNSPVILAVFALIFLVYRSWFTVWGTLSSGDWPYLFKETVYVWPLIPSDGYLWIEIYYRVTTDLGIKLLGLSWELIERIFWYLPFLIFSLISSYLLGRWLFQKIIKNSQYRVLSAVTSLIYTTNTYILMVVGGGQIGVALAYALSPLVFLSLINSPTEKNRKKAKFWLLPIIVTALQLMFDPRVFILTLVLTAAGILFLFTGNSNLLREKISANLKILLGALLLNSYWIISNLTIYREQYREATDQITLAYFSFATFSNTLSLLHPNWPENIFGKIYFMKAPFLVIPILAFLGFLFSKKRLSRNLWFSETKIICFWGFVALLGAFLAKGVQPPLPQVYFLLSKIPGFYAYRDPTKFYLFTALAYSILIPWSLFRLAKASNKILIRLKMSGFNKLAFNLILLGGILVWALLIKPAWLGQIKGTFKPKTVPRAYLSYKDFILDKPEGTVSLWIPRRQRFGFYAENYPALESETIWGQLKPEEIRETLTNSEGRKLLEEMGVNFIIIPSDAEGEIFQEDRRYSPQKRQQYLQVLDQLANLERIDLPALENLAVWRLK